MSLMNERLAGAQEGHRNRGGLVSGLELRDPWIEGCLSTMISAGSESISAQLMLFSLDLKKL